MIKIKSLSPLISMSLSFESNGNNFTVPVKIDSVNQRVFFELVPDGTNFSSVDFSLLETEVLNYIKPELLEPPIISNEIIKLMSNARSGTYKDYNEQQ